MQLEWLFLKVADESIRNIPEKRGNIEVGVSVTCRVTARTDFPWRKMPEIRGREEPTAHLNRGESVFYAGIWWGKCPRFLSVACDTTSMKYNQINE
ncbi:hypothetical protein WA026_011222 [Henosepilachna vigintioctopunctata]|uniref:Uncharacterized protein n=1 Tax=Henosepilachna vigintioctopunctata TaxID=420089 RepID=A0AAW1U601_9CUCU